MTEAVEALIEEARTRAASRPAGRDLAASVLMGGAFVAVAAAMALFLPWQRSLSPLDAGLLVLAYALLSRVEFELGPGCAIPTELVLVPMLFALPPALVPLCVGAGYALGGLLDVGRKRHLEREFVLLACSWHAVGPALVFVLFDAGAPAWADWPVYLGALAAQFAFDLGAALARDRLALGVSVRALLHALAWVYVVDAALAPIGLVTAFAATELPLAFLLALPLAGLLWLLARDRRQGVDRAIELASAYRDEHRRAQTDALTGVGNRLAWEEALEAEEARRRVAGGQTSVIVLDFNGLKAANDTYGHHFGDELLRSFAAVVRRSVRETDVVARVGGDELALLLPGTDEAGAGQMAWRLEEALTGHPGIGGVTLSAAVGHASSPPSPTLAEAQRLADARMYARKPALGVRA